MTRLFCICKVHRSFCKWHSLRLNADVADAAPQKSLRQFSKYCGPILNYAKIYIFYKYYIFNLKKSHFFLKGTKILLAVRKNGQCEEKFTKKLDTLFARWWFFLMADVYVWKSKMVKNMQDYTHIFCWTLGISINWWKSVFSQPVPQNKPNTAKTKNTL